MTPMVSCFGEPVSPLPAATSPRAFDLFMEADADGALGLPDLAIAW